MGTLSPGFHGRPRSPETKLPPGQYLAEDFPVLTAGPTPRIPLDQWEFVITTEVGQRHTWSWSRLTALPSVEQTVDLHCVTKWSKLGTGWRGVSVDTLLADVETAADYVMAHSYGGYTTNLPLEDLLDGQALDRLRVRRRTARRRARWPGPAARPAPLPVEVRQVGTWPAAHAGGRARVLGVGRLPRLRRPLARAALPGRLMTAPPTATGRPPRPSRLAAGHSGRRVAGDGLGA